MNRCDLPQPPGTRCDRRAIKFVDVYHEGRIICRVWHCKTHWAEREKRVC